MSVINFPGELRKRILGSFRSLSRLAIRRPVRVLVIATVVTLATAPGILRLKLRTDAHALVPQDAPEVRYDKALREQFGIEDQIVVLVQSKHPDGIFNPGTLQLVRELTADCQKLPGINSSNVMSLATEPSFRMRPSSLNHQTMLEPRLTTKAEMDQLREDLRQIELYNGTLVSSDGKSTCILFGAPAGADRVQLYAKVLELVAAKRPAQEEITVTGAPIAESLLGIHILEDLGLPKALLPAQTQAVAQTKEGKGPLSFYEIRLFIARRIGLVPVAALVMILVFLIAFRNFLAAMVPLPGVAATLMFVFGLMGWSDVPVYLTIAVMPVLLIAIGVMNDVYLFSRYFSQLRDRPGATPAELLGETFDQLASPVAVTSLTAAIGFGSFGLSPLQPVRAFGIFTAIGVLFGLLYSLTVVPAMLTLLKPVWLGRGPERRSPVMAEIPRGGTPARSRLGAWFEGSSTAVVRHRFWVIGLVVVTVAVLPLGLHRLEVQDSWIDGFDPGSEFRRTTTVVNDRFFGMHLLFVSVELPKMLDGEVPRSSLSQDGIVLRGGIVENPALIAGSAITISPIKGKGTNATSSESPVWQSHIEMVYGLGTNIATRVPRRDMPANLWEEFSKAAAFRFQVVIRSHVRPELIRTIDDLGKFIRERPQYAVGGVLSPADYVTTTRFMSRPTDPDARRMPNDPAEIKLMWDFYGLALGQDRLHQLVDTNYWRSLTTVFLKDANFRDTARLMDDLRNYEREKLAPKGIKIGFGGDVAVSQSLIRGIVTTQLQSLCWSLAGIYLVTAFLGGSWKWGVYCLVPSLLAVLIKFAVMGWLDIPLGVATSMFAAMTLGIGVNCAIHLLEAHALARASGASPTEALARAMRLTGPPALINTLAVSVGFGVLILSQVPANARLGLLLVIGLVNCFIASLLLLPVLLHWWPIHQRKLK